MSLLSRSLEQVLNHNVDGLLLCDLCDEETLDEREGIYTAVKERLLKEDKQYLLGLSGQGKIDDIEHARKFGVSIFEVNYPFLLAEKHIALIEEKGIYSEKHPIKK
eukprot:GHVR01126622.1.p1 GENE.GHVR01126622.1~~GHVR01126622.1.p1  ORF type:complete len:106 (+),score=6.85 GHVR01126622.1:1368-1685(+)